MYFFTVTHHELLEQSEARQLRGRGAIMSIWKLRLGLNPFTLLLAVFVGLICVVSYFYLLSFLLQVHIPSNPLSSL